MRLGKIFRRNEALHSWAADGWGVPAPAEVKRATLDRRALTGSPWLESGTYRGSTTAWLAERFPLVVSMEPSEALFSVAKQRLQGYPNVVLLNGASENVFPEALSVLSSERVNFWLDGHFSGGETFPGLQDTPILIELAFIEQSLASGQLVEIAVMVDDVRLFASRHKESPDDSCRLGYPPLSSLVSWAERLELFWGIEHDIFFATTSIGT